MDLVASLDYTHRSGLTEAFLIEHILCLKVRVVAKPCKFRVRESSLARLPFDSCGSHRGVKPTVTKAPCPILAPDLAPGALLSSL